jgi:hypothetical protein
MYIFKKFFLFLFFVSFNVMLFATVYDDGESKQTKKWHSLESYSLGTVKNIYDKSKKSHVLKLEGESTKSAYLLTLKEDKLEMDISNKVFHWEMKYSEDFVIMIGFNTIKGKRYLIYTPGNENSYLQYGLGSDTTEGKWRHYSRNLEADLKHFDRYNKIINLNNFVIKGSGFLDNIKMINRKKIDKKEPVKKEKVQERKIKIERIKELEKREIKKVQKNINSVPLIYMNGKNPLRLKRGETYIESGATARDREGTELLVSISEDIDIFREGEYSVIYMATNSSGNSVVDRRRVIVGAFRQKRDSRVLKKAEIEHQEEMSNLKQRVMEVAEWEKELARREKELAKKESSNNEHQNYPTRPGL